MSFFNKMKNLSTDMFKMSSDKYEETQLERKIAEKFEQQDELLHELGRVVFVHQLINIDEYKAHQSLTIEVAEQLNHLYEQIHNTTREIQSLEKRRDYLRDQKRCEHCGRVEPIATKFCPDCGTAFPIEQPKQVESTIGAIVVVCGHCGHNNDITAKFCSSCGTGLNS